MYSFPADRIQWRDVARRVILENREIISDPYTTDKMLGVPIGRCAHQE